MRRGEGEKGRRGEGEKAGATGARASLPARRGFRGVKRRKFDDVEKDVKRSAIDNIEKRRQTISDRQH